ncbi:CpaD family pilus assembly lipoprotein [Bradyrhizobium sp. CNPSo 4010]|uniref:CpaD family pilus assembly lipoprotein n=1 Tax=Bradyrhizobium agreste TaxID=2751811 RepID=A0ABS0PX77_9BRAD|nr:CpaD family pilus assembly lipoprotein [Bradyrhizobium agreste]MBH5401434.1 CpaD family pilus assembly lipoprotein [Bradyrhizobium agreste]
MTTLSADRRRSLRIALALTGLSVVLGACNTTEIVTQTVPTDYRQRHPIAVQEGRKSIVIFVGKSRGGLSAAQHADVAGIARDWVREGTGSVVVDVPVDTANARAVAGPCGLWPEDVGPSILDPGYTENRPYFNLGCASQRNFAAMIDNPADLEQPRAETPAYTARRDIAFERYRKGTTTATTYPESDKAKLSDTGR